MFHPEVGTTKRESYGHSPGAGPPLPLRVVVV